MIGHSEAPIAQDSRPLTPQIVRKRSRSEVKSPSEILSKREVLSILAKRFQTNNFVVERYCYNERPTLNPFTASDEHLTLEVDVTRLHDDGVETVTPKFFVKQLPSVPSCYDGPFKHTAFKKEIDIYSKMFNDYVKMETDPGRRQWWPTCYHSKPDRVLILEDLVESGYYQFGRMEHLDKEHVFAVLRSLAAFHSASLKFHCKANADENGSVAQGGDIKEQLNAGELYANLKSEAGSLMLGCHQDLFLHAGIKTQLDLVDLLPGYSRSEIYSIKQQLPQLIQQMTVDIRPSDKSLNVFVHGNLCTSNIFFRRNGSDLQAVFVDYQMCRYAPPALDLLMLAHMCMAQDTRPGDFQIMLQAYYNMLTVELAKAKINIHDHLPLRDFIDTCNDYTRYGIIGSVFYFQTYLLPSDCIAKYRADSERGKSLYADLSKMVCDSFSTSSEYRTRMTEAMNNVIRTCIKL